MSLFSIATIIIMVVTACEADGNCRKTERNIEEGRKCRKSCTTNSDCTAANKLCGCDGACGMSCFNPSAMCASLPPIENGNFSVTNMRIGGNVTYTCNEGFGIRGGRSRICRADKRWYPNAPLCENFAICGRSWPKKESSLGRVVAGKNADKNAWPWQVLVTRSSSSMKESLESNNLLGGGTILNQRWVLTAAHVFTDVKTVSNWPSNTVIFAGINERPAAQEEVDESVVAYSINKYYEHDGFNATTYINDIALIEVGCKLDQHLQPIETEALGFTYGYHIKPVCLPCARTCSNKTYHNAVSAEDSNFLTVELNPSETEVIVTGFGHTLKRSHNANAAMLLFKPPRVLQQTSLRIANNITCERGIRAIENKLSSRLGLRFTESMLCSEPSDADACNGDNGGPLVQKMTEENSGEERWVQVGIVSFGYGCGSTDPGYYTKVAEFIAWINETMKGCGAPVKVGQAFPNTTKTKFAIGDTVEYKCSNGYFMTGDAYRTCMRNGWSEMLPNCSLRRCDSLSVVYKGQITFTNALFYGSNATLSCAKGYQPESALSTTITCNAGEESTQYGGWSGQFPSCRKKFCDSPTPPRNGVVLHRNPEQRDYGTPITYECNIGFKLEGIDTGTCEDDGSWGQVPSCVLDPDCDFEDSTNPTCGFSYNGKSWERIRVMNDGLPGYVIEGKYRWSKLISANIPRDWSDGNTLCLKFRYKLLNYESSLRISSTNIYFHPDIYWSIRRNEALDVWHDFSRNIRTDRAIQYQFEVITPSVQLDDIVVSKGTCDFCQKRPCQNGGTCTSSWNGHTCSCRVGFTGSNCENDNCWGEPCRNGGTCVRNRSVYTCSCPLGFSGYSCNEVDHCWSSPCRNGGTCENNWTGYTCSCRVGFVGPNCENADFCQGRPCQNGGTCTSFQNGHTCSCRAGFSGSNCEIVNHCWSSPCRNDGTCESDSTGYTCYCTVGFSGSDCETAKSETKLDLMILIPGFRFHNQEDRTAYKDWLKALGKSIIPSHKYMMSIYQYGEKHLNYKWRHLFEYKLYLDGLSVAQFQSNIDSLNLVQPHAYPLLWPRTITSAGATTWGGRKKSGWSKILVIFVERTIDESSTNELANYVTCMQYNGISVYFIGVTSYRVIVQTFKTRLQAITGSIAGDGNLQFVELSQNGMEGSIQAITEFIEEQRTSCPRPNSPPQYDNWDCRWKILAKETFQSGEKVFLECRHRESIWWTKWQRHHLCKTDGAWTMIYTVPCEEGNSN